MASFYTNENFPTKVVDYLREMGHDVLTSYEAGNANQRIPDEDVLECAAKAGRILLTLNLRLHGVGLRVRQVRADGVVKKVRLLRHHANRGRKRLERHIAH